MDTPTPGTERITIAVSGAHGGKTVDFRRLTGRGITLLELTAGYENGHLKIADDLKANIDAGDRITNPTSAAADDYALANRLDLPLEPGAWDIPDSPWCVKDPIQILNNH